MVNIRTKSILLSLVIFIFLLNTVHAGTGKLIFSDVDVKVGSRTSNNLANGDTIGQDARPGDALEFRVELRNNYTNAENLRIQSITTKVTVEGIDDGSDLEDETSEFDLSPQSTKRSTIKFQVPLEVDEETFDVLIEAEGSDKNGTRQLASMRIRLDVDKETHKLKITRKTLAPASISCNRKNVQLGITVQNIGSDDEENVVFQITSTDLGIDFKDNVGELRSGSTDSDTRFSKTYSFNVPTDLEAGSYPVTLAALYDSDRKKTEESVSLNVNDCQTKIVQETTQTQNTDTTTQTTTAPPVTVVEPSTSGTTTQVSFLSSNAFLAVVIIIMLIAVIGGIALIAALFRGR